MRSGGQWRGFAQDLLNVIDEPWRSVLEGVAGKRSDAWTEIRFPSALRCGSVCVCVVQEGKACLYAWECVCVCVHVGK